MQMTDRTPEWLTPIAWVFIAASLVTAAVLAYDLFGRGRRGAPHAATDLVWVASALFLGPFALVLHRRIGVRDEDGHGPGDGMSPAARATVAALPGGAASAVAHLVGVPLVLASGLTIAGIDLWVMILVIGALAMLVLLAFEHAVPPRLGGASSLGEAAGAAVLTVLAFDVGMGGWMLLLHYNELMPPATEGSFWFLMQVGIVLGMLTGSPAVSWLARRRRQPVLAA